MIIYRPVTPLTTGQPGLASAFAAMALTAVLGLSWRVSNEPSAARVTLEASRYAYPAMAGRDQP